MADQETTPFSWRARAQSFRYALAGGQVLLMGQHNAWIHAAATVAVVIAGLVFRLRALEWALVALAIGMVWAMEAVNTAIELLADELSLERRPRLGKAKDVAAFGVLAAALAAVGIGLLVFLPRLFT
ncbi:MAG: diacylglycerol kinase family protein [Desulfobulbus sp.]|jgi:diacylglycerol kinase (ATP)|uniref:diacylglycerol kinase family protein n=1 Tax=Desulfobulbus sp. TaxID=895 RepID=UPI00284B0FFB|nr:diacylglycerol kinase family protein [Desulfobulbus sp.]MDR2549214.1 diacylglycerol kinase family protein [Desulfobulbus sp.]